MRFVKSIAGSFILVVLLILVLGQGGLWAWFLSSHKTQNMEMLTNKIRSMGTLIAAYSAPVLVVGDVETLDRYLDGVIRDTDIISVRISDNTGAVIKEKSSRIEQRPVSRNPFYVPWSNRLKVPIKSEAVDMGTVEIIYSGNSANAAMKRLLTVPPLGQALVFLLMIYVIYIFFQRKVGKPIGTIHENINKATAGDLTVKLPDMGGSELGLIAKGLDFLVKSISSTVGKLHSTSDNVAMAIKQLNMTFGNVIKGSQQQASSVDEISRSLRQANESQKKTAEAAEKLSGFSAENVTSLIEMRTIAGEIAGSTNKLFQATDSSYSTVAELSQTAKEMSDNAEKVQSSVEDALASVEEISASVKEVETSAKESTALAENVREMAANKGIMAVTDAIDGMERIAERVRFSVDIVRRLGSRSKDIEKMLSVIKEVTEQTNLLSLNAAILAAQAGEYGKGFSVVADEIRALSDRTAASTKEITGIVSTIQNEISDAVVSIESGVGLVDDGSALVYKAGESIGSILEAAQKSVRMAMAIENATEEQARGLKQISSTVDDIRKMVSHMTMAASEQFKASEYILERTGEVREVAESTKRGTEEQALGTKVISKNIELASERVVEISQAAHHQQKVNETIIATIEQIRSIGAATLRDVEAVSMSLSTLEGEMNLLRKEMEAFKVE